MADENAKNNAVQQAQVWAQEARTQRATVLSILRFFGLPEHDYEALTLIQEKDSEGRAAMLLALDALEDNDIPAAAAILRTLLAGVRVLGEGQQ